MNVRASVISFPRISSIVSVVASLALLVLPRVAKADPQLHTALTVGGAITDLRTVGPGVAFELGGRANLIFLRNRSSDMGLGPYIDIQTVAFDRLDTGGGLDWVVPGLGGSFILSGGAFGRFEPGGPRAGALGRLFWGAHSYNFHGSYVHGAGLFAEGRFALDASKSADVIVGAEIDLFYLAAPAIFLYEAMK